MNSLVAVGVSPDFHVNEYEQTLMHQAAYLGKTHAMDWLKQQRLDVNVKDVNGGTPAHLAAMSGAVPSLIWLEENGGKLDAEDNSGVTPLAIAIELKQDAVVEWFRERE